MNNTDTKESLIADIERIEAKIKKLKQSGYRSLDIRIYNLSRCKENAIEQLRQLTKSEEENKNGKPHPKRRHRH